MTIQEIQKLQEQLESAKMEFSTKKENIQPQVDEIIKQLETVGASFRLLCGLGGVNPETILGDEKVKTALLPFVSTVKIVRGKIPSIEALVEFMGSDERSKKQIAEKFKCSEAHVNGFLKKHNTAIVSRKEDPNNKLSKLLYKVAPPQPTTAPKGKKK